MCYLLFLALTKGLLQYNALSVHPNLCLMCRKTAAARVEGSAEAGHETHCFSLATTTGGDGEIWAEV